MTAGRGIVHSERTPERLKGEVFRLHGLQTWLALPKESEEVAPAFVHHPRSTLPVVHDPDGAEIVVVADGLGARAPVAVFVDTLYAAVTLPAGCCLAVPPEHVERALYCVAGEVEIDGETPPEGHLVVLHPDTTPLVRARADATFMLRRRPRPCPPPHVVELRPQRPRPHRPRPGRLGGRALRGGAGRDGIHPPSGAVTTAGRRATTASIHASASPVATRCSAGNKGHDAPCRREGVRVQPRVDGHRGGEQHRQRTRDGAPGRGREVAEEGVQRGPERREEATRR